MSAPELSISIVSWNTRELLRDCLRSVREDPRSAAWELFVVDNGSRDGSADMVEESFPGVEVIRSRENLGFSAGNNLALARARGRHLLILNSDTRVDPGALGGMVDFADGNPGVGAVGPRLEDGGGSLERSWGRSPGAISLIGHKLLLHRLFPFHRLARRRPPEGRDVGWVTGACLLVRRQAAKAAGPLDDGMFMCHEDVEWCMRLRHAGWRVVYLPRSRVVHLEGRSIRQRLGEMLVVSQQSQYYLFQKHFGRVRLHALRLLTAIEMILRAALWSLLWLGRPASRAEARDRLGAYRRILWRTVADRSYWAPRDPRPGGAS